jgi:hypothetical protein
VDYDGESYSVRFAAFDEDEASFVPRVWAREIVPSVATVKGPNICEFPTDEAVSAVLACIPGDRSFATFRLARWDGEKVVTKRRHLRDRQTIDGRVPVDRAEWREKHGDMRGSNIEDDPRMIDLDSNDETRSYPVVLVGPTRSGNTSW